MVAFNTFRMHLAQPLGGFTISADWTAQLGTGDNTNPWVWLGDFNGDGKTDIASYVTGYGGKKLHMNLSTGTGFTVSDPQAISYATGTPFLVADFTGDGKTDVIGVKRIQCGEGSCYNGITDLPALYASSPSPSHLLALVENSIGGVTTITYTPSSSYLNATLPFVIQTVSAITVDDGNGTASTTEYSYAHGLYNHADREFYGFGYARSINPKGTVTETWCNQREASGVPNRFKGLPSAQMVSKGGLLYAYAKNFYKDTQTTPVFPYLATKDDHLCDDTDTCRRMRTNLFYDSYGNITDKEVMECFGALADIGDAIPSVCTAIADYRHEHSTYAVNTRILNRPLSVHLYDDTTRKAETRFAYDGATMGSASVTRGNLTAKEEWNDTGEGPLTTYAYNAYGNQTSVTDPMGNTTTMTYDATYTYVASVTNALGHRIDTTWDVRFGKPLTKTIPYAGGPPVVTTFTYDTFGRPVTIIQPPDATPTVSYSYHDFGSVGNQRVGKTVKDGPWSETYFDGLGRTIAVSRESTGAPIVAATVYDEIGKVERQELPCFGKSTLNLSCTVTPPYTTFAYDPIGRIEKTTFYGKPAVVTTVLYDKGKITTIDPEGHVKEHVKDIHGRLVSVIEYSGVYPNHKRYATTNYAYDVPGNLVSVTDNAGNTTTMTYDSLSRKIAMHDMDMGAWGYGYDGNGNLVSQTDAKGQTIAFTYDQLNRVTKKRYPSGKEIVSTYDSGLYGTGKLTSVADLSGSASFTYDVRGRTVSTTKTITGLSGSYTTRYAYDSLDRTVGITYPTNMTVTYSYDKAGNLNQVAEGGTVHASYENYTASGQVGRIRYRDPVNPSAVTTHAYDADNGRLTGMVTINRSLQTLQDLAYAYSLTRNVKEIADRVDDRRTRHFTYDEQSRLVTAEGGYGRREFRYNELGNVMYTTTMGDYTYPAPGSAHPHGVTGAGLYGYEYDENGNVTKMFYNGKTQKTIEWTYDNKPSAINGITFSYDYAGRRVKKEGSVITYYIDPVLEYSNGAFTAYIFANGKRIVRKTGSDVSYYHADHLGSTGSETSENGARTYEAHYTPYGETWYSSGIEKYKFTGQEEDAETGFYNYGARHYDPALARFISADSIVPDPADPQSLNRYSYCRNNPVMYVDPSGHFFDPFSWAAIIGAGIGALSAGVSSDWDPAQMAIGVGIGWVSGGVASEVAGATTGHLLAAVVETYTGDVISSVGFATASIGGSVAGGAAGGMVAGGLSSAIYDGNVLEGMGYGMLFGGIASGIFGSIDYYGRGLQGNAYNFGPSAGARRGVIYDGTRGWGDVLTVNGLEWKAARPYDPFLPNDNCVRIPKWRWDGEQTFGLAWGGRDVTFTRCYYQFGHITTCYTSAGQEIFNFYQFAFGKWTPYIDPLSGLTMRRYVDIQDIGCPFAPKKVNPLR
jgi:RHS repeat-associated protein